MSHTEDTHKNWRYRFFAPVALMLMLGLSASITTASLPTSGLNTAPNQCSLSWQVVASPNAGTGSNLLLGIAATSSTDVWAVGRFASGSTPQTLIEHWDGNAWSIVPSPNVAASGNILYGVDAISSTDAWAVGYSFTSSTNQTLIVHWDGSAWTIVPSPNVGTGYNFLQGVTAISSTDVWAVGYYYSGSTSQTLVEHWDGSAWTVVSSPNPSTSANIFYGVTAISSTDIWAVGTYRNSSNINQTLIEHWDGSAWTVISSPNVGTFSNILYGVDAVSSTDVWAVGNYYSNNGGSTYQTLVEHWDGSAWTVVASPSPTTDSNRLLAVAAISSTDVWAVGYYYITTGGGSYQTLVEHWDGSAWTVVASPNPGTRFNELYGVDAVSSTDVWAAGGYYDSIPGPDRTLVEHYSDSGPCETPTPSSTSTATNSPTATRTRTPSPSATPRPPTQTPGGPTATAEPPTSTVAPSATSTACTITFTDVDQTNVFYPFIRCLACRGTISGYSDGTFRPFNDITRGQIAKIVSNAAGFDEDPGAQIYEDVPVGSPFYQWINRLSMRGHIGGYPCGLLPEEPCIEPGNLPYFRPSSSATRGQLAKIVANAAGIDTDPAGQFYTDVPEGHTFYTWIMRLTNLGVMSGYDCGGGGEPCDDQQRPYFRPFNNVTRGQASKIVANTFYPNCQTPSRR